MGKASAAAAPEPAVAIQRLRMASWMTSAAPGRLRAPARAAGLPAAACAPLGALDAAPRSPMVADQRLAGRKLAASLSGRLGGIRASSSTP